MNRRLAVFGAFVALSIIFASARKAPAATDLPNYELLNRIAACQSVACVEANRTAVKQKTEWTVFYASWLLLKPSSREASKGLLENIPATDQEQMQLFTLPVWHKGATSTDEQMELLDRIHSEWPRLLSAAALRWPEYLPAYIGYGKLAAHYLHTEYADYERKVCRKDRSGFSAAFRTLNADDQNIIRGFVFDPDGCATILVTDPFQ
jgi:hypothetical protein